MRFLSILLIISGAFVFACGALVEEKVVVEKGKPGLQGPQGPQGRQGFSGPAGQGNRLIYGQGEPNIVIGANGDSYADTESARFYEKVGNDWQERLDLSKNIETCEISETDETYDFSCPGFDMVQMQKPKVLVCVCTSEYSLVNESHYLWELGNENILHLGKCRATWNGYAQLYEGCREDYQ